MKLILVHVFDPDYGSHWKACAINDSGMAEYTNFSEKDERITSLYQDAVRPMRPSEAVMAKIAPMIDRKPPSHDITVGIALFSPNPGEEYEWQCSCGKLVEGYDTEEAARDAGFAHVEEVLAWRRQQAEATKVAP